ncbi:hypothetical protein A2U01_0063039, partial [Trifolium medium]|nr:hypothetical protein [Trifolium medium]
SPFTEDEDEVQVITERQAGKQPQKPPQNSAKKTQQDPSPSALDITALLATLRQTNTMLNEQNKRITTLEENQRHIMDYCRFPPWRPQRSAIPPTKQAEPNKRRLPLERLQQPSKKR